VENSKRQKGKGKREKGKGKRDKHKDKDKERLEPFGFEALLSCTAESRVILAILSEDSPNS
jgi:hypothetical protein